MGGLQGTAITVLTKSPPLVEGGLFPLRRGGADRVVRPYKDFWKIHGIATPVCGLARNDASIWELPLRRG